MFDIRWIRDNPAAFDAGMEQRGLGRQSGALLGLDRERREIQTKLQELQTQRNEASKAIGAAKAKGGDATSLIDEVASLKDALRASEAAERGIVAKLEAALAGLPNIPADDVPAGEDEGANVELRRWGNRPELDFAPKEHFELGEALGLMDFDAGAKISGARFVVLKGALARLDRALGALMLDLMTTEYGYTEIVPPLLVRDEAAFGTGQLPKFSDDLFKATRLDRDDLLKTVSADLRAWANELLEREVNPLSGEAQNKALREHVDKVQAEYQSRIEAALDSGDYEERYWLIPTAEVPLTNLVREQILDESDLPLRMTALTPCFRSEAGAAGKDTRGMIRQHQFNKVEIVSIVHPDQAAAEHERLTACAEEVLKRLDLHYRVVTLCTGDLGFSSHKTYDIEVWLPGQERFREISSCSNFGDFQARRMDARYRPRGEKGTRFVHTLNGSGLAVGRTLIAVMENYQMADGSIVVPDALRSYMGGLEIIGQDGGAVGR